MLSWGPRPHNRPQNNNHNQVDQGTLFRVMLVQATCTVGFAPVAVLVFYPAGGGGPMVRIGREGDITDAAPMALRYYDDGVAAHDLKLAKLALLCGVKWKSHPKYGCQQLVPKLPPLHLCVCRCLVCQVDSMTSVSSTPSVQLCGKSRGHRSPHVCYDCEDKMFRMQRTRLKQDHYRW